jgi:peptide-methionine (S)-S-oxide reductase
MTLTQTQIREHDRRAMDTEATATATFGIGCFWGPDAQFGALDGVVRTRVGYAGGTKRDPTYHSLGDHTEVFQVDFDPDTISYRDLLELVFESHTPRRQTGKTQYQNVVLAATADQRAILDEFLAARGLTADGIETRIEQLSRFYLAEEYHQKYTLRSVSSFMDAFEAAGYGDDDLRESPIAAKLNGYAAGHDVSVTEELPARS